MTLPFWCGSGKLGLHHDNKKDLRGLMATYKEIQGYVKDKYNITVKTCWISDKKECHGLDKKVASN